MNKSKAVSVLVLLFAWTLAFAHGGGEHVLGTVAATSSHSITVKTRSGETTEVELTQATKFMRSEAAVTLADVHPGDRVVVHTRKQAGKLVAIEVQLGAKAPGR
jgi:hypothetical protein